MCQENHKCEDKSPSVTDILILCSQSRLKLPSLTMSLSYTSSSEILCSLWQSHRTKMSCWCTRFLKLSTNLSVFFWGMLLAWMEAHPKRVCISTALQLSLDEKSFFAFSILQTFVSMPWSITEIILQLNRSLVTSTTQKAAVCQLLLEETCVKYFQA